MDSQNRFVKRLQDANQPEVARAERNLVFLCVLVFYSFYQWATSTKNTFSLNFHKYWYGSCHTGHIAGALTVEFIIQKLVCHVCTTVNVNVIFTY